MKCPIDETPLSVSSREGVEIDFCPQCRGVWLDRGELDKIIDRAATTMAPTAPAAAPAGGDSWRDQPPRQADRDDSYDDRSGRKRKRRSFLDDLFDFD